MSIASRITSIENHIEEAYTEISRLGVDLTNVDKNIDNIADMLQEAYENTPKVTEEGSSLSLTPTRKGGLTIIPKGACEQDTLPSEYQAVEYIESSGTQYIDTGVLNTGTMEVELTALVNESSSQQGIFGANRGGDTGSQLRLYTGRSGAVNKLQFNYNNSSIINYDTEIANLNTSNKNKYIFGNGIFKINDNIYTTYSKATFSNAQTSVIFGVKDIIGTIGFKASMKLYYLKITDNGIVLRNFCPCYRISDNEIGLYDLVNGVFYTNQGTGTFIKGNDTGIPNPDYPQDIRVVIGDNSVVVQNKNLLDVSSINGIFYGADFDGRDGTLKINGTYQGATYLQIGTVYLKANTIYTSNFVLKSGTAKSGKTDISLDLVTYYGNTYKRFNGINEIPADGIYNLYIANGYSSNSIFTNAVYEIQLEKGTTSTSFVKHAEQSITLHLGTNYLDGIGDYKDEIVGKTDEWKIKRYVGKVIFDGSDDENWVDTVSYERMKIEVSNFKSPAPTILGNILCDKMIAYTRNTVGLHDYAISAGNENTSDIWARANSTINTVAKFKTWLTTHNLLVYYQLETPTEETITDTQLIESLNNMYQAMGYDGTTNIEITSASGNAQMTASVSALKGE